MTSNTVPQNSPNPMAQNAPYRGPAPAPSRSLSLVDGDVDVQRMTSVDPSTLTSGIPPIGSDAILASSRGPSDPDIAAKVTSLEGRISELIQGITQRDAQHAREKAELALQYEATMASLIEREANQNFQPAHNAGNDDGGDGEGDGGQITRGALMSALKAFGNSLAAQTQTYVTRALSGITPEQEAAVLRQYPYLSNLPEPKKSEFIRKALSLQSEAAPAANTASGTGNASASASNQTSSVQARPAPQRFVPQPEASLPGGYGEDATPVNASASAVVRYEQAKLIKDPKQRLVAMKAAANDAMRAAGMTPEQFAKAAWQQS